MRVAKQATGGKARLDCSGMLFLRSLCRLTHVGHAQYYKGIYPLSCTPPTLPTRSLTLNMLIRNMEGFGKRLKTS